MAIVKKSDNSKASVRPSSSEEKEKPNTQSLDETNIEDLDDLEDQGDGPDSNEEQVKNQPEAPAKPMIHGKVESEKSKENKRVLEAATDSETESVIEWMKDLKKKLDSGELVLTTPDKKSPIKSSEKNQVLYDEDEDPLLDKPVRFFAPTTQLAIFGYKDDNEKVILPPYGDCVEFVPISRYLDPKDKKTISICGVEVKTKKLFDFMVNNPQYSISYFMTIEDASDVLSEDLIKHEYIQGEMMRIGSLKKPDLIQELKMNNFKIQSENLRSLGKKLAIKLGTERYEKRQDSTKSKLTKGIEAFLEKGSSDD